MNPIRQIRKAVFETNSSSSHSLTLGKGDLVPLPFSADILRKGEVSVPVGDFNWEWHRYYLPLNKIQYLLTQITDGNLTTDSLEDLTRYDDNFAMLHKAVKDYTGCDLVPLPSTGGIDHQSARGERGVGMELFESVEALKKFIFDGSAYIQTGNDNEPVPWSIETDKGEEELFYQSRFAELPTRYKPLVLVDPDDMNSPSLTTPGGAVLSEDDNTELFKEVQARGIVSNIDWECGRGFDRLKYYGDNEKKGAAASEVTHRHRPIHITRGLTVSSSYSSKRAVSRLVLTVHLPASLHTKLTALSAPVEKRKAS